MIVWMTLSDWRSLPTLSRDEIEGERERDKKEKGIEMEETAQLSIWYVRKIIKSTSKSNKAQMTKKYLHLTPLEILHKNLDGSKWMSSGFKHFPFRKLRERSTSLKTHFSRTRTFVRTSTTLVVAYICIDSGKPS